ncbi:MAG: GNAT family protein [Polyangiales bacterium]
MTEIKNELGYRRYEWKCDSRNAASRRAAERLGFRVEFRPGRAPASALGDVLADAALYGFNNLNA